MMIKDIDSVVDIIFNEISKYGFTEYTYGLRKDDAVYGTGDTPRNSNHWYDFNWEEATSLDGTCATEIDLIYCLDDEVEEAKQIIKDAININKDYMGRNWYLLCCEYGNTDEGQDENEVIMKDAKILLKIEF